MKNYTACDECLDVTLDASMSAYDSSSSELESCNVLSTLVMVMSQVKRW